MEKDSIEQRPRSTGICEFSSKKVKYCKHDSKSKCRDPLLAFLLALGKLLDLHGFESYNI